MYHGLSQRSHVQVLCFLTLSSVLFLLEHTVFQRLDSVSVFRWNLLSWTQSIELAPISGNQHQHKAGCIYQVQHKPSARIKTNIKNIN
jgi:hypothetical protein